MDEKALFWTKVKINTDWNWGRDCRTETLKNLKRLLCQNWLLETHSQQTSIWQSHTIWTRTKTKSTILSIKRETQIRHITIDPTINVTEISISILIPVEPSNKIIWEKNHLAKNEVKTNHVVAIEKKELNLTKSQVTLF